MSTLLDKLKKLGDKKLPIIVVPIFFSFFIYQNAYHLYEMHKYGKFTICKITGVTYIGSNQNLEYVYYVNDSLYTYHSDPPGKDIKKQKGNYYVVKYSTRNPKMTKVYLDSLVRDARRIQNAGFKLSVDEKYDLMMGR